MEKNSNHAATLKSENPWNAYTTAYRRRNPDKTYRWHINSCVRALAKHVKEHPEEAQDIRERVFGA